VAVAIAFTACIAAGRGGAQRPAVPPLASSERAQAPASSSPSPTTESRFASIQHVSAAPQAALEPHAPRATDEPAPVASAFPFSPFQQACEREFALALKPLPACSRFFQDWMKRFSKAADEKTWSVAGLSINNEYTATQSDPSSEGQVELEVLPRSSFADGTALQRMEELDMRGGLRCLDDAELGCGEFSCEPFGKDEISCGNARGEHFSYRWQRFEDQWYLVDVYQLWLN
jgi:hypothetical protein